MTGSDLFAESGEADRVGTDLERVADKRPGPMFAGPDRYFDEPEPEDRTATLGRWARANRKGRENLLKFAEWCCVAGDGERRAVMVILERYQGRTPAGAIEDTAKLAGVSRMHVHRAIKRFVKYFPGAISETRRRVDNGRS